MNAMDIASRGDAGSAHPGVGAGDPTLLGRKSVLIGMAASVGVVFATAAQPSAMATGTVKPIAATQTTYALKWTPSTAYARGQQVISPDNDVVSAKVAHTSTAAYAADTLKWSLSSTFLTTILPEKYSAVGDGVTDDTAAVTAALAAASDAGGVVHLAARRYHVPGGLTVPAGVTITGEGKTRSALNGAVWIGGGVTIRDLRIGKDGDHSSFTDGATGSIIERVHFKGGSGSATFYLNNSSATDCRFIDCDFTDNINAGNGVQIVDKGTALMHYENITFQRCTFHDNTRMNFECIQRDNGVGFPVVTGYRGIDLLDCDFAPCIGPDVNTNVSYDCGLLTDASGRSSGYSRIDGCRIKGGGYGLELAGCIEMLVTNNEIRDATGELLSVSQVGVEQTHNIFKGNRFVGVGNVTLQGAKNLFDGNYVQTTGALRLAPATESQISNNFIDCLGPTGISVENASRLWVVGNYIAGGTGQSILNIYAGSIANVYQGNCYANLNVTLDVRDGVVVTDIGNVSRYLDVVKQGAHLSEVVALPVAVAALRGLIFTLVGATGTADTLHICMKGADDTYSWAQISAA
jgi:Right handed beta helix region/Pectate lyase superfamily protein